jgi:hypothetical protein
MKVENAKGREREGEIRLSLDSSSYSNKLANERWSGKWDAKAGAREQGRDEEKHTATTTQGLESERTNDE